MSRRDRPRWDDGQLMDLALRVSDEQARDDAAPRSRAPVRRPAELSVDDVVASGRAAYCWLDVVVWLRDVTRHPRWAAGVSTDREPGH
ncbi:hypothetical protein [Geodermatophilus sp. SYSU D01105]